MGVGDGVGDGHEDCGGGAVAGDVGDEDAPLAVGEWEEVVVIAAGACGASIRAARVRSRGCRGAIAGAASAGCRRRPEFAAERGEGGWSLFFSTRFWVPRPKRPACQCRMGIIDSSGSGRVGARRRIWLACPPSWCSAGEAMSRSASFEIEPAGSSARRRGQQVVEKHGPIRGSANSPRMRPDNKRSAGRRPKWIDVFREARTG